MSTFNSLLFPLIEPDTGLGLFALKPLLIAGMTRPVVGGDGGINIDVVNDPDGMLCVINPYLGMQAGDQHDIYWGVLKIWHKEVEADEVNERLYFYLPTDPITPDPLEPVWVEEVYYQLTRKGSTTPDDPSVPLRLLVKLDEPGGYDKEPHKPGHSELKPVILPDDVIQNGVTAEWAEKGVPMTVPVYPGIYLRDFIYLWWGSVPLAPHVVTQRQVDGTDPIIIVADQEAILAGGDSNALTVEYEMHDEVWNWCQKRSLSTTVLVDAGAWRLEPAIIKQSINGVIDLIKLGKEDVTVQIHVRTDDFDIGDTVVMTWIGTPFQGEQLVHRSKPTPISNIPSILELNIPNADIRAIAMGKADVSYVLTKKDGGPPLSSKRTFANVVGEISQLPAPTIREVIGDTLEPDKSVATVDIRPSDLIKGGDLINLVWLGTKSNGDPYLHEIPRFVSDGEVGKVITIGVPEEHIRVLENGKLNLYYRVSNDKSALYGVKESEYAFYNVQAVRAELPAPKVVEAPNDFLDPAWIPGAATLRIGYLGTAAGDELTYYWRGPTAAGSTSDWIPITTIIAGKPVDFRIDERFITPNQKQQVNVRYALKRAAKGRFSYSGLLELYVGEETSPSIEKITDSQGHEIPEGGGTIDTTVVVIGRATPSLRVEIRVTGITPQPVIVSDSGIWTLTLNDLAWAPYSVVAKALYGNGKESAPWTFTVIKEELARPEVTEADANDVLDPATVPSGANAVIKPYDAMVAGDEVFITWTSGGNPRPHEDNKRISSNQVGKPVEFLIPYEVVVAALNFDATLVYRVNRFSGGTSSSKPLVLHVKTQAVTLPDPVIRQANGTDQLNIDDVPNGATVLIGVAAKLKEGDEVRVQWKGSTTTHYPHTVLSGDEDKELAITVPHEIVDADNRETIDLSYIVVRKHGGTDPSLSMSYRVLRVIDSGALKVMGARFNRSTYRSSGVSRILSAFSLATDQSLRVEWQYSADTVWKAATTWRDTDPWKLLHVRSATHSITLNPANIIGNGVDTSVAGQAAFVAHRDSADVVGWGNTAFGASIPQPIGALIDIVEVSCTRSAYAARRASGQVMVWGPAPEGGNMGAVSPLNFAHVIGNSLAFTGIKADGQVVAWGDGASGGNVPAAIGAYRDIVRVYGAGQAFAARRVSGEVIAWGLSGNGGTVPGSIGSLRDIVDVAGSYGAFAALRSGGQLVAWGHAGYGGQIPTDIAARSDIVQLSGANAQAFTALSSIGQVVAWGTAAYGGAVPSNISALTGIVEVSAAWRAFAVRQGTGRVFAWGVAAQGGTVPGPIALLNDIVQVVGSSQAFAALRKSGAVVAWGDASVGGSTAAVANELVDVQALYSNSHGFTALTSDGRVVTWGHAAGGGNSSGVQDKLRGNVSYQAKGAQSIDIAAAGLRAPTVDEAPDGVIDPEKIPERGAMVRIEPYTGMAYRDHVYLSVGSYTDDIPIGSGAVGRDVEFLVPRTVFQASVGQKIPVQYEVQFYQGPRTPSKVLDLSIELGFENPVTFDLSPMNYVVAQKPPVQFPAFVRMTREASWGAAPYHFSSSDESIASVNDNGEVTANTNGLCTISATDSLDKTRGYELTIKGVQQLHFLSPDADWEGMKTVCAAASLEPVTLAQIKRLWELYFPSSGPVAQYLGLLSYPIWTGDSLGAGTAWGYDLNGTSMNENASGYATDKFLQVIGTSRALSQNGGRFS